MNEAELLRDEISDLIKDAINEYSEDHFIYLEDTLVTSDWIAEFYGARKFLPAWSEKGKLNRDADSLLAFIRECNIYGLAPEHYSLFKIEKKYGSTFDSKAKKFNVTNLSEVDFLLTDAFYRLCVHLSKGRINPDSLTGEWKGKMADSTIVSRLSHALESHSIRQTLESYEPVSAQYHLLKKFLSEFRARFENNPWDSIPAGDVTGETFKENLKQRLLASDDYDSTLAKNDSVKLAFALKSFQLKHGLNADGKIGINTLRLLNKTVSDHIHHLEMSMERWRWEKPAYEDRYVWINIPSYKFRLIDCDTVALRSRIICGAPDKQSPELNSTINYFVIYPYWNIPLSIATKEMLPILKRYTDYLRKHNIEMLDRRDNPVDLKKINWKKLNENYFPYRLRQRDGDENTLGVMKFIFPNKFGVYLHDTNARNLFGKEVRSLSHGCIRLEKAKEFATYLLKVQDDTVSFTLDSLQSYLNKKVQKQVGIRPRFPIHIKYFTCEADSDHVIFYDDVYKKDEKMIQELYLEK